MDDMFYIANWKSHKTEKEGEIFFDKLNSKIKEIDLSNKKIIIAPPFTLLGFCKRAINTHMIPVSLSGQNVSPFPEGAYTGEINAIQLKEFAEYVIIGHSERRKYFHEESNVIENKVREANEAGLKIIQCIQDENDLVFRGVGIVAYEPPSAIGSGNPDDPEHVSYVFDKVMKSYPDVKLLYGGSVNSDTIKNYLSIKTLSGFLIGGASLEAETFLGLLNG